MVPKRYPRPGQRLVPNSIADLFQVPIDWGAVPLPAVSGELPAEPSLPQYLSELDESIWERLNATACEALALQVVHAAGGLVRTSEALAKRHCVAVPANLDLSELPLEPRTMNCLTEAGLHLRPGELSRMTLRDLLKLRGFGAKSLLDLLVCLEIALEQRQAPGKRSKARARSRRSGKRSRGYPQPNYRIAPQLFHDILQDPLPASWVRQAAHGPRLLAELDESAWQFFDESQLRQAARRVVRRVKARIRHTGLLDSELPRLPAGVRLEELPLDERTSEWLKRQGLEQWLRGKKRVTVREFLERPGAEVKMLVEWVAVCETLIAKPRGKVGRIEPLIRQLRELLGESDVYFSDPRLGTYLRAIDERASSLREVLSHLEKEEFSSIRHSWLMQRLVELRDRLTEVLSQSLNEELAELFAGGRSERDRDIILRYFGWAGEPPVTLEALGRKYGVSRERIRQICLWASRFPTPERVFTPVLDRVLRWLAEEIPRRASDLQKELITRGFTQLPIELGPIRQAAEFLGRSVPFELVPVGTEALAVPPGQAAWPGEIVHAAEEIAGSWGVASVELVEEKLAERIQNGWDGRAIRVMIAQTLELLPGFHWLDEKRLWFALNPDPSKGLGRVVAKVLGVVSRIEPESLAMAVQRARRGQPAVPPVEVLTNFCQRVMKTRIDSKGRIIRTQQTPQFPLVGAEKILVTALEQRGPVSGRLVLEEACLGLGMNRFTLSALLVFSPLVVPLGRGHYALIGHEHEHPADLELDMSSEPRPKVLQSFGRTEDGRIYLVYRLSRGVVNGGVVSVPVQLRTRIQGSYCLVSEEGERTGTLVVKNGCAWGLGPAIRRRAVPGQWLVLWIDPERQQAEFWCRDSVDLSQFDVQDPVSA